MNNTTEIIFGDSLHYEMKNSKFAKNKIIKFDTLFSIADLSNIDSNILKLNQEYCELISKELMYEIKDTYSFDLILKEIEKSINNYDKIRIWTTHNQIDSYLMFLYICNYFSKIDYDISVLFSDEYNKKFYSPACMRVEELESLENLEHKLSKEDIRKFSNIWNKIKEENSDIRDIDNGEVKSVSFDYYNDIILNKLRELGGVQTVTLVANILKDNNLYDTIYTFLINRLIKQSKIKIIKQEDRLWKSTIIITK